jgi:hypothetical protein
VVFSSVSLIADFVRWRATAIAAHANRDNKDPILARTHSVPEIEWRMSQSN